MAIPTSTTTYGKIIPKVFKNQVSSRIDKLQGFKYPVASTNGKGYYSKSSGIDLIKSSLKALLKTSRGERFMLPNYGCNAKRYLMEPLDEVTFTAIKDEVTDAINRYLKEVVLLKLQAFRTSSDAINIKIFCKMRDAESINFDLSLDL